MATRSQKRRVDVRVFPSFRGAAPAASVRRAAATALALADPDGRSGASVVVADDETLHDLNLRFRGFDEVTDVLSFGEYGAPVEDTALPAGEPFPGGGFPAVPPGEPFPGGGFPAVPPGEPFPGGGFPALPAGEPFPGGGFPAVPGEEPSLGEVVLSYPMAERQAREHDVPVEQEAALLVVHGILHLLGHDHAEPEEEEAMRAIERQALGALFPSAAGAEAS